MSELTYPEHQHPHGLHNKPANPERIYVCDECDSCFSDTEMREDFAKVGWGHKCKCRTAKKNERCESHLESYKPDVPKIKQE